jgi:hypothetical protein
MARQRPCRVCRKWFRPDPRAGDRQHTCDAPACQRERHRRACAAWHRSNTDYDREDRLRRRLHREVTPLVTDPLAVPPMARLDREAARDAVGLEVMVVLEVVAQLLWTATRDAVVAQRVGRKEVARRLPGPTARDGMVAGRPPP